MASTNLADVLLIDPSQLGKAAAADTAFQSIDAMINGLLTLAANELTSPFTLPFQTGDEPAASKPALRFVYCLITGALSAPFVVYMPAGKQRLFIIDNETTGGQTVTFMVEGQTGVTVQPGDAAVCFLNGTDVTQPPLILAAGTQPWEVGNFIDGAPTNGQVLMRFIAARTITFPANFTLNQFNAGVAATSSAVFTVNKNGTQVGTATVAASGTTATWASTGAVEVIYNAGDVGTFVGPSTADATLANAVWSFAGYR
jgi:hypothetical protein